MPKKYLKKWLPSHDSIRQNRWIGLFGARLHHPGLWHLHRRSVSGGVAVGLLCGLIPGPLQMMGAALLSVWFHVNLPVALFSTLYTNPLTIVPLYWLAYQLGALVTGQGLDAGVQQFTLPEVSWSNWPSVTLEWLLSFGKPLAVGLPLLAVALALLGYTAVRLLWRLGVLWQWRKRGERARRNLEKN